MNNEAPFMQFMNAVGENEELRKEVVQLAAKHGIDFSQGELDDDQLDSVAGGGLVGDDAQLRNLDLQSSLNRQRQAMQLLSSISRKMHRTSMSIIRNLR